MQLIKQNIYNNFIESEYSKITSLDYRKKYAQFFTPFQIADIMAKWILGNNNLKSVCEPAFGLGIFSRALLKYNKNIAIKGFEVDKNIFDKSKDLFSDYENIRIVLNDYMFNDWENKYDGIICNPPYFKFHDYDNKNVIKEVENKISFKLNGFTNLYTLFLLKSIYQLNRDGRAAYIIPSEFLNSDYGKLVKSYLIKSKTLRHIIIIDFEENVFDDAMTTASILFCANDTCSNKVQFTNISKISDLQKIEELITNYPLYSTNHQVVKFQDLNPKIKWRAYYQEQTFLRFKKLVPFENYGKVVRGIATGANEYFTFSISKSKKFNIGFNFLLPCICKAIDAKNTFFTKEDFESLKENDKSTFLLNAIPPLDDNVIKYINKGESEEIHKKYLTSKRNPWYSLEKRPPSPIWVSVFNRNGLRFIKNEANISNLTTFHCIYPIQTDLFSNVNIDLLFSYLLTDVAKQIFGDNRREYGNGLQKFEPNDINKANMLDLKQLKLNDVTEILTYYKHYRQSVLENKHDESYISRINDLLIEQFS